MASESNNEESNDEDNFETIVQLSVSIGGESGDANPESATAEAAE